MDGFDRRFWRQTLEDRQAVLGIGPRDGFPLGLLAVSLLLTGSTKGADVVFSYVNRDMMTALSGATPRCSSATCC